jgi:hypothetical protein
MACRQSHCDFASLYITLELGSFWMPFALIRDCCTFARCRPSKKFTCYAHLQPHEDGPAFWPAVAILSLGGPAVIRFWRKQPDGEGGRKLDLPLLHPCFLLAAFIKAVGVGLRKTIPTFHYVGVPMRDFEAHTQFMLGHRCYSQRFGQKVVNHC